MRILRLTVFIAATLWCLSVSAHVGSPNVVVEGKAGPYTVRVFVRPPTVVPGVAEINVRVLEGHADSITVLPVYWQTGHAGAPIPDQAKPVPGESNLFSGGLWLMQSGAYSIDIHASGPLGDGTLAVPVNSIATNTKPMSRAYGIMLACLGMALVVNLIKIVGKIFGESLAGPEGISPRSVRNGRLAMAVAGVAITLVLYGGKHWWDIEENNYRSKRLYRPVVLETTVAPKDEWPTLSLKIDSKSRRSDASPLLPDHGKIMHLFAVRKGGGLEAFAHLHPISAPGHSYQTPLPPLPAGEYDLYADITHEDGFAETWTATAAFPTPRPGAVPVASNPRDAVCSMPLAIGGKILPFDPDDSWHVSALNDASAALQAAQISNSPLPDGREMVWLNRAPIHPDEETVLQFQLQGPNHAPLPIVPYMGMAGHAAVRRDDGSVFAHLHPGGTISMAAQRYFVKRDIVKGTSGESSSSMTNGTAPFLDHNRHTNTVGEIGTPQIVSFPYAFPKPGDYRIWVQMKSGEQVFTGVFYAKVEAKMGVHPGL